MRSLVVILVALLVTGTLAGCQGDNACVQWGSADGPCPSRDEALALIAPTCEEPIESIDSDGEIDGDACCYEVTHAEESACE